MIKMKQVYFSIIAIVLLLLEGNPVNAQMHFRETVWLQINRDIYLAGDELNYKALVLENDTYKPSVLSKNIRIELIDQEGNKIVKSNIELSNSIISGKIILPENLASGWYQVVSYTNWMRNFSESSFSKHSIRVLNPGDAIQDSLLTVNKNLKLRIYPYPDPENPQQMRCSVFASDNTDNGLSSQGFILSGPGDTVMTYHTNSTGWTSTNYRPSDIDRYQVFALGIEKENIDFEIVDRNVNKGQVKTSITERYGYVNISLQGTSPGRSYKLLAHRKYSWSWFHTITADNENLIFRIPVRDLPSGISQCTVLDQDNNILFKQLWSDYSSESTAIGVEMDTSSVRTDDRANFSYYSTGNYDGDKQEALNIMVDRYIPGSRIHSYLPGLPGWQSDYQIPIKQEAFEGWIMTNSYPDIICKSFFSKDPDLPGTPDVEGTGETISYFPETRGGIFCGKIYNKNTLEPVAHKYLALTVLNDNSFYATSTNKQGRFAFTFPEQYGPRDYLMNYIEEYDPSWQIDIMDEYASLEIKTPQKKVSFTLQELEFLRQQSLNNKLKELYFLEKSISRPLADTVAPKKLFYGVPDISILVDDYIDLPNVREVIFEVVPYVVVRQHKKQYELKVTGDYLFSSEYPTLILLDGIPVYDYQELLALPPDRIKSIDAINAFYVHGNAIFEGIVNIKSRNNDFGGLNIPPTTIMSTMILPEKGSYLPILNTRNKQSGMPDFENLLLWERSAASSASEKNIFIGDNPGEYIISIYGFDNNARWHSGKLVFKVSEPR